MGLQFHGDAIELSGVTGTKLKSEVLGAYYEMWWNITSGGDRGAHNNHTAIIELNAGTGEAYLPDTGETILGSSGHALMLKGENPNTSKLQLVLVEEEALCFSHLKNVINRRWKELPCKESVPQFDETAIEGQVYLFNDNLDQALTKLEKIPFLGNSLFFFDPLLFTEWEKIDSVASKRITGFYHTGTEFILFLFTSDLFLGRKGLITGLPTANEPSKWNNEQSDAVTKVDSIFGHKEWRSELLTTKPLQERMDAMVRLYSKRLQKWFRYVLPLPFEPKFGQTYHIFMCSNYEAGVRITRNFYSKFTNNPKFSPDNRAAYNRFVALHPEKRLIGNARSEEWKFLWAIIKEHQDGICDANCRDLIKEQSDFARRLEHLKWLESKGYLNNLGPLTDAWEERFDAYKLNWSYVSKVLGITPPLPFKPLSAKVP